MFERRGRVALRLDRGNARARVLLRPQPLLGARDRLLRGVQIRGCAQLGAGDARRLYGLPGIAHLLNGRALTACEAIYTEQHHD